MAKGASDVNVKREKERLFKDHSIRSGLEEAVFFGVFNVHWALLDFLEKRGVVKYSYPCRRDRERAQAVLENVRNRLVPESQVREALKVGFAADPFNEDLHEEWLCRFGDRDRSFEAFTEAYGWMGLNTVKCQVPDD